MDEITDNLFKFIMWMNQRHMRKQDYIQFKTDYDRENPILKHEALVDFKKEYRESKKYLLK